MTDEQQLEELHKDLTRFVQVLDKFSKETPAGLGKHYVRRHVDAHTQVAKLLRKILDEEVTDD